MKNKIGRVKIAVCAVFFALCGAAFFLPSAVKIFVAEIKAGEAENPQNCAACHQEEFDSRHRIILKRAASEKATSGAVVSCAECHGNASEHLAAKTSVWARIGFSTENKIINPRDLSSDAAMLVCANCHSRELNEARDFMPFSAAENVTELVSAHEQNEFDSEKFWSNGESKFSGNEFAAIVRSVCYAQSKSGGHGITGEKINCAGCHSSHESNGADSVSEKTYDQSCIQCHSQFSNESAIAEHTKHLPNSEASSCVSCHQPETIYGRMRFTRTHEISVPNPLLTIEKQIPNACNLCHTNQSVNWAVASSKKLWSERFRAAEVSSDKQFNRPEGLRALSANDALWRALAVYSLQKYSEPNWSAPFLFEAYQTEKSALVKHFLSAAIKPFNHNSPQNLNSKSVEIQKSARIASEK